MRTNNAGMAHTTGVQNPLDAQFVSIQVQLELPRDEMVSAQKNFATHRANTKKLRCDARLKGRSSHLPVVKTGD
jgi:hypothetical protein